MSGVSLSMKLIAEKARYIESTGVEGGTASGFRRYMRGRYQERKDEYNVLVLDAIMESATKRWQAPARSVGPLLLIVAGESIREFVTRHAADNVEGEKYEKVHYMFATVNDLDEDTEIHSRKAAQSLAAVERQRRQFEVARRRAGGNLKAFLRDLTDDKYDI